VLFAHCYFNHTKEIAMKIKTKVRAGGCRGGTTTTKSAN